MAKRKTCWAKNAPQLLCFLATVAYSLVFLSYHSELLSDPKGAKSGNDGDSHPQTNQLNLVEVQSKDFDNAGEGDAEAHAPSNSLDSANTAGDDMPRATEEALPEEAGRMEENPAKKAQLSEPATEPEGAASSDVAGAGAAEPEQILTVALAANSKQLDGVLVVINSALSNSKTPSRLKFCILTTHQDAKPLVDSVKRRLAKLQPDVSAVDFDPWAPRVRQLLGGKSSSRKELFDELNFAAFYLHEALPLARRVLYLDTDVVVTSDLAHLVGIDLHGHPAAAAEDCSQRLGKYVDMNRMKAKGVESKMPLPLHASKKTCVVNRGVVLVDTAQWAANNITAAIEALVRLHLAKGMGPLWRAGVSQPPFLLAIAGRYHDLGAEFNVRGLGRGDIAPEEVEFYKKRKTWSSYFDTFLLKCKIHCCPGCKGWALSPYVSPLAHQAKILHFNGRLKPSHQGFRGCDPVKPPSRQLGEEERAAREQRPLCSCGSGCLQECACIWWKHLPE
ncbi:GLT8D1 [Symbiodinium sp. KB8]|nr:GLT8D1 [Symbiodinium sp. KB8]